MANNIMLTGRLTKDPSYTEGVDGKTSRAYFTVASDRAGEGADFIPVTVFGKTADNAHKYLGQGHQVAVTGHIESSNYEQDGTTRYSLDIIGDRIDYLAKPAGQNPPSQALANTAQAAATKNPDGPGRG